MAFWLVVLGSAFLVAMGCGLYLVTRVLKFGVLCRLMSTNRTAAILIAVAVILLVAVVCILCMGAMSTVIGVIHLAIFWVLCDAGAAIIRKLAVRGAMGTEEACRSGASGVYIAGICAVSITVIYLVVAWILAHNISPTVYSITTDKNVDRLRIIQFADAHIGTTFEADGFERAVAKMQEYNPDIVVITGDLIDDSTTEANFEKCCEALGRLQTKYGVYYVFGNHDKSYRSTMADMAAEGLSGTRKNGAGNIIAELTKNGVIVLQDESVLIDDSIYVIGRQDFNQSRLSMERLIAGLDSDKYMIVLDHQPRDYEAQAAAKVDLVLSGHTHGGQMLPLAPLVRKLGSNDMVYGYEKRDNTDFIVTSGISDWEIKFKTGCKSEFVVVDVNQK